MAIFDACKHDILQFIKIIASKHVRHYTDIRHLYKLNRPIRVPPVRARHDPFFGENQERQGKCGLFVFRIIDVRRFLGLRLGFEVDGHRIGFLQPAAQVDFAAARAAEWHDRRFFRVKSAVTGWAVIFSHAVFAQAESDRVQSFESPDLVFLLSLSLLLLDSLEPLLAFSAASAPCLYDLLR